MLLDAIYPGMPQEHGGVGYAAQSIVQGICDAGHRAALSCVTVDHRWRRPFHRLAMPPWAKSLGYRVFSKERLLARTESLFLSGLSTDSVAHVWPGTSISLLQALATRETPIVLESINNHTATCHRIQSAEYAKFNLPIRRDISKAAIRLENARIAIADFIFSPCEMVSQSLLNAGVASNKIISTSYGLRQSDIFSEEELAERRRRTRLRAIFVGRIGIRKSAHLLLKNWKNAGVDGDLIMVGNIEPDAEPLIRPLLQQSNVTHVPYTTDLRSVYRHADIFLLPSIEEGSALVTYLALGAGLPSLVSPMGASGIITHGSEGIIIDPYDSDAWVQSIRRIFSDDQHRQHLATNASRKAPEYLWKRVGHERHTLLHTRLNQA